MLNVRNVLPIVTYVKKQRTPKVFFFFFPFSSYSFQEGGVSLEEQYNLGIFLRAVCVFFFGVFYAEFYDAFFFFFVFCAADAYLQVQISFS